MYLYIFHLDTVRVPGPEDGFHQFCQLCPIPKNKNKNKIPKNVFKLSLKEKGDRFKEPVITNGKIK